MGKILITGATGNIGKYIVKYTNLNNDNYIMATSNIDKSNQEDFVYLDFTKPESFLKALNGVDRIFIVRPPHLGKPEDLYPFIDFISNKKDMELVVFLSLIGVEKNPAPPHHKIEKYIEKANLPYCHVRPSFFMQNLSGIHAFEIKHFDKIVIPAGNSVTAFIDTEDIGEFIAHILNEPSKHKSTAYSLTGDRAINYYEVAKIMSEELGRDIRYTKPKNSFAKKYWTNVRGIEKGYAAVMSMLYILTVLGTAKTITNTFEQVMAKKPRSFREFVKNNMASWSE